MSLIAKGGKSFLPPPEGVWPAVCVDVVELFKRKQRNTISHHRQACARCGRMVAHTQGGIPFLHNCRPLEVPRASNE